jgi:hypothetical protein
MEVDSSLSVSESITLVSPGTRETQETKIEALQPRADESTQYDGGVIQIERSIPDIKLQSDQLPGYRLSAFDIDSQFPVCHRDNHMSAARQVQDSRETNSRRGEAHLHR